MKFFGWKAAGGGPARPALSRFAVWSGAALGEWPGSYEAQAREGYLRNPVAQRAVRLVAEGVASAPLIASDPALAALVMARSGGQALLEALATHLLLHGNAYAQVLTDSEGMVRELFALRPERVTVAPDARGWPVAYSYRIGDRVTRLIAEDPDGRPQIIHLKAFNPLDDHYGLGALGAASGPIAIHNSATKWNKALLDNAARPSGAMVYEPGDGAVLSREQFDRLRGEIDGYAVPKVIDAQIDETLKAVSPIRSIANVVKVGSAGYRKLVTVGGTPSGWGAETDPPASTGTPTFYEIVPPMGELYANPSASQAMLDDAQFDVEGWLAHEIAMEFASAEGTAFVNGSGTARPKGFLQYPTAATGDSTRAFGTLQYLASGAAGDFAADPEDKLIDLVQSLRAPYRQGAVFVMASRCQPLLPRSARRSRSVRSARQANRGRRP